MADPTTNPKVKPRVFVALPMAEHYQEILREHFDLDVYAGNGPITSEALALSIAAVDGVLGSAQLPFPSHVLDAAPRLRVICNVGVGYDNVDLAELTRRGISIANTPGVLSGAVAELVFGLMIAMSRGLRQSEQVVREGRWGRGAALPFGSDLQRKTLSIVGMGRIGREVADRAAAFKMSLVGYDARPDIDVPRLVQRAETLDEALAAGDFVSLHVDLNASTRHLIGAAQLARMKPSAYLINTARGPVVDQAALYDALRERRIAGAALDVLEVEPPEVKDPLLKLENVYIVPHIGSATVETRAAMMELAVENLIACLSGGDCANVVNRAVT